MTKREKLYVALLGLFLGGFGFAIAWTVNWKIVFAIFLMIWGENLYDKVKSL